LFGFLNLCANCTNNTYRNVARAHYCGLCNTLGSRYGLLSRWFTNYDASFYSLLYSAQTNREIETQYCPLKFQKTEALSNEGLIYGGAISMLMAKTKIEDNIKDSKTASSRVLRAFIDKKMPAVYKDLKKHGLDTGYIASQIRLQETLENEESSSLFDLSNPTENVVARIVSHTATLSGKNQNIELLRDLGSNIGRLMYILDSYKDLPTDIQQDKFNPFIKHSKGIKSNVSHAQGTKSLHGST
jgi:hypothetical protein